MTGRAGSWRTAASVSLRLTLAAAAGVVVTAGVLETAARLILPEQTRDSCALPSGYGGNFRPNCTSEPMRLPEGPWLRTTTNGCGYRTAESCGARPEGGLRIAVLGTSTARGHFVAYHDTFAARAGAALSRQCQRPVEFQNLAIPRASFNDKPVWHHMADRAAEAIALRPDAVIVVMASDDLAFYVSNTAAPDTPAVPIQTATGPIKLLKRLKKMLSDNSRALLIARIAVYRDVARYLPIFLRDHDEADYLRTPLSKEWELRLRLADTTLARMSAPVIRAGVPWFVVLMPTYGNAVVAAAPPTPGVDPYLLAKRLSALVTARGGKMLDLTSTMAHQPNLAGFYYVVDGHPNAAGHAVIAHAVANMLRGGVAAFADCGNAS